jgi:hypothetical protein
VHNKFFILKGTYLLISANGNMFMYLISSISLSLITNYICLVWKFSNVDL